jgi:hypothetical protein
VAQRERAVSIYGDSYDELERLAGEVREPRGAIKVGTSLRSLRTWMLCSSVCLALFMDQGCRAAGTALPLPSPRLNHR